MLPPAWIRLVWVTFVFGGVPYYTRTTCWALQERTVVLLYHKPANVITSHATDDVKSRPNVYQDVTSMRGWVGATPSPPQQKGSFAEASGVRSRLHAVGRLDADTTGALLLTNDGGLVHHVTNREAGKQSPHVISKTYHAVIMGHYANDAAALQQMREDGVDIGAKYGGKTRPVEDLEVLDHPMPKSTTVSLTISEGKNRQIRRMFHAVGSGVMKLERVRIGVGLDLSGLQEGQWRILSDEEVQTCLSYTPRLLGTESPITSAKSRRKGRKSSDHFGQKRQRRRRS